MSIQKLFITDLDGTALGGGFLPYDRFPDHYSDFLDELAADGWDWAINTTWDPEGQWKLIERSKVKSRPSFLIAEFGRQLVKVENGSLVRVQPYTDENNRKIAEFCREKLLPILHRIFLRIPPKQVFYYEHLTSATFREDISPEVLPELREVMDSGEFHLDLGKKSFSMRPAFLSKGLPMPLLNSEFGYAPENIVCAGDEATDIAMMQPEFSRVYLAPANLVPELGRHIEAHGGFIGKREFAWGVIDAFRVWSKSK